MIISYSKEDCPYVTLYSVIMPSITEGQNETTTSVVGDESHAL